MLTIASGSMTTWVIQQWTYHKYTELHVTHIQWNPSELLPPEDKKNVWLWRDLNVWLWRDFSLIKGVIYTEKADLRPQVMFSIKGIPVSRDSSIKGIPV